MEGSRFIKIINRIKGRERKVDMVAFRAEIAALKARRGREEFKEMLELLAVNVEELTEEDARMWYKIKARSVTRQEFNIYAEEVIESENESRNNFRQVLANKVMLILDFE